MTWVSMNDCNADADADAGAEGMDGSVEAAEVLRERWLVFFFIAVDTILELTECARRNGTAAPVPPPCCSKVSGSTDDLVKARALT